MKTVLAPGMFHCSSWYQAPDKSITSRLSAFFLGRFIRGRESYDLHPGGPSDVYGLDDILVRSIPRRFHEHQLGGPIVVDLVQSSIELR